jgi:hypothetical protein
MNDSSKLWRRSTPWTRRAAGLAVVGLLFFGPTTPGQEVMPPPAKVQEKSSSSSPDPQRVFRLESESELRQRMSREAKQGINPLKLRYEAVFPTYPPVRPPVPFARVWEPLGERIEPAYLCYGRLYFEQLNGERYGWDLGPLHPLIAAGTFYFDVAAWPYHAATDPLRCYECNTGYALPGMPMPLLLYRPEFSWTGTAAEAAAIGLLLVCFP